MKKFITILIGFLIAFSSYSQNPNTFRKITNFLGDSSNSVEKINGIAKLDTTYILLITGQTDSTYWDLLIVEIDKHGNPLNEYYQTDPDINYMPYPGQVILVDRDTNIVVISSLVHTDDGQQDVYVLKLTPDLDTVWSNTFVYTDTSTCQDPPTLRPYAFDQTPDGGYIIGLHYFKDCEPSHANNRSGLLKLNSAGQEQWRIYYTNKNKMHSIAVTDSGDLVFTDRFYGYNVVKTDSLGNVLWEVKPTDYGAHFAFAEIAVKDDYVIAVSPHAYNHPVSNPYDVRFGVDISKIDLYSGQLIWNKRYRVFKSFKNGTLYNNYELRVLDNDDIVLAGPTIGAYVNGEVYDCHGVLFRFNSQGDSLWCRLYNHDREQNSEAPFNDLVVTDDGGFLAGGWFHNGSQLSSWLVKTDSMGMAPGVVYHDSASSLPHRTGEEETVILYPNPATEHIYFDLGALQHPRDFELTIYNMHGQSVKQRTIENAHPRVSLRHLPPGVYLYRFQNQNGREVYEGRFIKK